MTALNWITKEAKKLRKEYPKRFSSWREYVAQASAIYSKKHKGKSPVGKKHKVSGVKKKAVKKAVKKATPKSSYHKDKNSHNVKISVMSGINEQHEKLIRKLSSKFLKITGYTQLSKDVLKKHIPIKNVINAVDLAVQDYFIRVDRGTFSKQLKQKAIDTKKHWDVYKKTFL